MAEQKRDKLKTYFEAGDKPTQDEFEDLIDSTLNKSDDGISVDQVKNIGIGITDPQAKLDVGGSIAVNSSLVIDTKGRWVGDPTGLKGEKGDTGNTGPRGLAGAQGQKGDTGSQGQKGDTGAQGLKGDTGSQGPKGDTGAQGPKGDAGAQGLKGDKGDKGEKGDKGDPGSPGTGANSPWNENANALHTSKKVGVGMDKPVTELEVKGFITQTQVAFSIEGSNSADERVLLEFDTFITNESGAWNEADHRFVAPVGGIYVFSLSFHRIENDKNNPYIPISFSLNKNGKVIPRYGGAVSYTSEFSSSTVTLKLKKGDIITAFLKVPGSSTVKGPFLRSYTLSGYRL